MSAAGNIGQNSSKEAACGGVFCARRGPLSTPPVALPVVSFFRLTDSCNMSLFKPRLGFVLACIFLDALGIGLIVPVLPRLIGTLTTSHDAQTWWYGMIMLSYGVMQFVSAPLLGALSDRYGRRPVLLAGICGLGVMFAVPAFFASLPAILASRIAGGMLSANMAVAQAYVADLTTGYERSAAFGKIGATFGIGFVVGPALGGILGQNDPTIPFVVASAVTLINFFYGLFALPESLTNPNPRPLSLAASTPFASLAAMLREPRARLFLLTLALTGLANGVMQCTWALYTEFRYGFTPLQIGLSVFALGISISLVQGFLLQRLLARLHSQLIAALAIASGAVCLAAIGVSTNGLVAVIFVCLYACAGAVSPLLTAAISRETPLDAQGKAIGSVSSLNSLTGAVAPALGTPLLMVTTGQSPESLLAGTPYFACALLSAAALVLFVFGMRRLSEKSSAAAESAAADDDGISGFED